MRSSNAPRGRPFTLYVHDRRGCEPDRTLHFASESEARTAALEVLRDWPDVPVWLQTPWGKCRRIELDSATYWRIVEEQLRADHERRHWLIERERDERIESAEKTAALMGDGGARYFETWQRAAWQQYDAAVERLRDDFSREMSRNREGVAP